MNDTEGTPTMLPEPLVPADVDLKGYEFMPFHGHRLFGSGFDARCNDKEWRAGVTLWWASWNQVPAASLPADDAALCRLADYGRDVKAWRKLRDNALYGFVLCSDGRLYHPVLAELAIKAWSGRVRERGRQAALRARRAAEKARDEASREPDQSADVTRTSRDCNAYETGDATETSCLRGRGRGTVREREGADAAGVHVARDPAADGGAKLRISGVETSRVREAVARGDLLGVLRAFACDTTGDRMCEWTADADGMQLGKVVVILGWRRAEGERIRQPSGFRKARVEWEAMERQQRRDWAETLSPHYGLPAPVAIMPAEAPTDLAEAVSR